MTVPPNQTSSNTFSIACGYNMAAESNTPFLEAEPLHSANW